VAIEVPIQRITVRHHHPESLPDLSGTP